MPFPRPQNITTGWEPGRGFAATGERRFAAEQSRSIFRGSAITAGRKRPSRKVTTGEKRPPRKVTAQREDTMGWGSLRSGQSSVYTPPPRPPMGSRAGLPFQDLIRQY